MRAICILLIATLFPAIASNGAPTSQPASAPTSDDTTPLGFMHASSQSLPAGGLPAALAIFAANDARERQTARAEADYVLAISQVELSARQKWGQQADDDFVHALGEKTDTDVDQATIQMQGDRAQLIFKGEENTPENLIRIDGHWKIDVGADIRQMEKQKTSVEASNLYCAKATVMINQLSREFAAGKFASSEDLCKETAGRVAQMNNASPM
jgi:hypothetical protein